MCSTSLVTMRIDFVFDLILFLHIAPDSYAISSPYRYTYTHTHTYTYTCTHTYAHTHTRTHMHT